MSPDPLDNSAGVPYEHLAELRATCRVSQTASGAYYLADMREQPSLTSEPGQVEIVVGGVVVHRCGDMV